MKRLPKNYAWHFVGKTLRDGSPIPPDGEWLTFAGECIMCQSGLHASRNPFDALQYTPGNTLCLVEVADIVEEQSDKLVCRKRKIIARMDATELCQYFARYAALSVVHLWDAPDGVLDFLMTGKNAAEAAWAAAGAARAAGAAETAWAAAWAAARAAGAAIDASAADSTWAALRNEFTQLVYESFEEYLP